MHFETIDSFIGYWERVRGRTERVIAVIPRERFDWAPGPNRWSFADLIRHLAAIERFMFAENARRRPSRYPGHGRDLADGPEQVLAFFELCHREAIAMLSQLEPADLQCRCATPGGASLPVWKWLRAMVEHEIHHRGQIYLGLGLLGIPTPPLYGLSSEEVAARSIE